MSKLKILQTFLAIFLLVALVYFVGGDELLSVFLKLDWFYIFILLLLSVVLIWASCLKWRLFIRATQGQEDISLVYLMKLYTIGYFFNMFTPSYLGGDAARSYQLGKFLGSQRQAFVATFLERFTGLLAMCLLAVFFVLFGASATAGVSLSILVLSCLVFIASLPCFSQFWADLVFNLSAKLLKMFLPARFADKALALLDKVHVGMDYARGNFRLLFSALAYSFLFHLLTVVNTYVACRAVGWPSPDFAGLFVVVPLILLVGMLPLTPSGVGLQEGAFVFFLGRIGIETSFGLAVGLVLRAKIIIISIIGGLLFIGLRDSTKRSRSRENYAKPIA